MKARRLRLVDAQLDDRNVGRRIDVAEYRPGAVIEPPVLVERYGEWGEKVCHTTSQLRTSRRRILHLIQLSGEAAEVVNRARAGRRGHGGFGNVPVRRYGQDRLWSGHRGTESFPGLGVLVPLKRVQR